MSIIDPTFAIIGNSSTQSQNLKILSNSDGTFTIGRADGSQTLMTIDGSGNVLTTKAATQSMVRLNTGNGYGSTNTKIFRFTNITTNQGSDITYADSAALGASFTINTNGVYSISISAGMAISDYIGISLNTTQPSVSVAGLSNASELVCVGNASSVGNASATMYLPALSVITPHGTGTAFGGTAANQQFIITRVS